MNKLASKGMSSLDVQFSIVERRLTKDIDVKISCIFLYTRPVRGAQQSSAALFDSTRVKAQKTNIFFIFKLATLQESKLAPPIIKIYGCEH